MDEHHATQVQSPAAGASGTARAVAAMTQLTGTAATRARGVAAVAPATGAGATPDAQVRGVAAVVPRPRVAGSVPTRARGVAPVGSPPCGRATVTARLVAAWPIAAAVSALLLWTGAVTVADAGRMGDLGLVTVLPWWYFAGVAVLVAALTRELGRPRTAVMVLLTAVLVVYLFGTASAVEPVARLAVSWYHAGMTEWIVEQGRPLPPIDARASWPGGFALAALIVYATGVEHASDLLRWAPPVFELLYLAPLRMIAAALRVGPRAGWLGTLTFYLVNWIEQDYFSPQALNMLFYLAVLAAVLGLWQPPDLLERPRGSWRGPPRLVAAWLRHWWRQRFSGRGRLGSPARQTVVFGFLLVLLAACVVSHQLTPYALVLALIAAFFSRRLPGPELPVALGVLAVGWLNLAAVDFWSGHLDFIFGSVGQVNSSVQANVGQRVHGAPEHELVVRARMLLTVVVFGLAALGVLRRRRRQGRALEVLAAAPFGLVLMQSYGGEGLMRVVLFSLPFTALLAGVALAPLLDQPDRSRLRRVGGVAVTAAVLGVLASWLTVVRGGNDAYVSFSAADRAAVLQVYDRLQPGQSLGFCAPYLPLGDRLLDRYRPVVPDEHESASRAEISDQLLLARPDYVIFTASQRRWGEQVRGWPAEWQAQVVQRFRANGYRQVPTDASVTLLQAPAVP